MSLLTDVLAERFPTVSEVEAEREAAIPNLHYREGREGFTSLEILLLQARRAAPA